MQISSIFIKWSETALNSSGDVFFTATAEYYDRMKKGQS